jgi:hypothetical protein
MEIHDIFIQYYWVITYHGKSAMGFYIKLIISRAFAVAKHTGFFAVF